MKIKILELETNRVEKEIEVSRFAYIPSWIWPYECSKCGWDLDDELQIAVEADKKVYHYHTRCWEELNK